MPPSNHRPLSSAAMTTLAEIERAPLPRQEVNPGVAGRLERESLVEFVELPSPYKTRKGKVTHLQITETGRRKLANR